MANRIEITVENGGDSTDLVDALKDVNTTIKTKQSIQNDQETSETQTC